MIFRRRSKSRPRFIFIGGTGRSGTTIVGDLLAQHPQVRLSNPTEIKFFSNNGGAIDLAFGSRFKNQSPDNNISFWNIRTRNNRRKNEKARFDRAFSKFVESIFEKWWDIDSPPPHGPGLSSGIHRSDFEKLLGKLGNRRYRNPRMAVAKFLSAYVSTQNEAGDEFYWVETSPMNIVNANRIHLLFPDALFINMVRDPRDVIASLLTKNWGPESALEGITWIEDRLHEGASSLKEVPVSQQITISLEDLTCNSRSASYLRLLDFLHLEDSPKMRSFFDSELTQDRSSQGRWRMEIDSEEFNKAFDDMCRRLENNGVDFYRST